MEENTKEALKPGDLMIDASGVDYELVPEGEPLKFHISEVNTVMGKNYNSGEPEKKLALGFKLDEEITGKGQVYSQWFTPSISEKANLTKLVKAVFGEVPVPFDPTSLMGMPVRATLINKKKDATSAVRQYIDTFLKPAAGQKKVEADVVPEDVEDGEDVNLDDIDFG